MITRNPVDLVSLAPAGRILGFDSGGSRVGLAVSDSARRMATSAAVVARKPWSTLKAAVEGWKVQGVTAAVIGWPLNMDGSEGSACDAAMSLAKLVESECGLPVLLWDERLSSRQAEAAFFEQREGRQTRGSKKESTGKIDAGAAVVVLQSVLDSLQNI